MENKVFPKVSVVIVARNAEYTISKTLESVGNQTYKNIETIVIDGASTDGTCTRIMQFLDKISFYVSEPDAGIYDAMNKGLGHSHGELVYFLGADDYLINRDVIYKVAMAYENQGKPDFMYGNVIVFNSFHNREERRWGELTIDKIKRCINPSHQAAFMKRTAIYEKGCFDTIYKISADFDLMAKLYKDNSIKIKYIDMDVAYFGTNGSSSKTNIKQILDSSQILRRHFGVLYGIKFFINYTLKQIITYLARKTGIINIYYYFLGIH
jgi:glycosyltransferase involved in cell wall biosynthesis